MLENSREQRPKKHVGRDIQIGPEEMRFQAEALKRGSISGDDQAVEDCVFPVLSVLRGRPVRNGESEPPRQRGQSQRQDKAVVKTIGEEEEEQRGREQIVVPLAGEQVKPGLDISEFYGP